MKAIAHSAGKDSQKAKKDMTNFSCDEIWLTHQIQIAAVCHGCGDQLIRLQEKIQKLLVASRGEEVFTRFKFTMFWLQSVQRQNSLFACCRPSAQPSSDVCSEPGLISWTATTAIRPRQTYTHKKRLTLSPRAKRSFPHCTMSWQPSSREQIQPTTNRKPQALFKSQNPDRLANYCSPPQNLAVNIWEGTGKETTPRVIAAREAEADLDKKKMRELEFKQYLKTEVREHNIWVLR